MFSLDLTQVLSEDHLLVAETGVRDAHIHCKFRMLNSWIEGFSVDPYLSGQLNAETIIGHQDAGVIANLKVRFFAPSWMSIIH